MPDFDSMDFANKDSDHVLPEPYSRETEATGVFMCSCLIFHAFLPELGSIRSLQTHWIS